MLNCFSLRVSISRTTAVASSSADPLRYPTVRVSLGRSALYAAVRLVNRSKYSGVVTAPSCLATSRNACLACSYASAAPDSCMPSARRIPAIARSTSVCRAGCAVRSRYSPFAASAAISRRSRAARTCSWLNPSRGLPPSPIMVFTSCCARASCLCRSVLSAIGVSRRIRWALLTAPSTIPRSIIAA